jgi:hypothetical protein
LLALMDIHEVCPFKKKKDITLNDSAAASSSNGDKKDERILTDHEKNRMMDLMHGITNWIGSKDRDTSEKMQATMKRLHGNGKDLTTGDMTNLSNMVHSVLERISPADEEDANDPLLSDPSIDERKKAAIKAARLVEDQQQRLQFEQGLANVLDPENIPKEVLYQQEKQKREAQLNREVKRKALKTQGKSPREFSLCGHFNKATHSFVEQLWQYRKDVIVDNHPYFAELKTVLDELTAIYEKDQGTDEIIKPVGDWICRHQSRLEAKDITLFTDPNHVLLKRIKSKGLVKSFEEDALLAVWELNDVTKMMKYAVLYTNLYRGGMTELMEIMNEIMEDIGYSPGADPRKIDKRALKKSIYDHLNMEELKRFEKILSRKSTTGADGKEKTSPIDAICSLLQQMLPTCFGSTIQSAASKLNVTPNSQAEKEMESDDDDDDDDD